MRRAASVRASIIALDMGGSSGSGTGRHALPTLVATKLHGTGYTPSQEQDIFYGM
jgi:hypothetical protein